jgi:hypothetical protein
MEESGLASRSSGMQQSSHSLKKPGIGPQSDMERFYEPFLSEFGPRNTRQLRLLSDGICGPKVISRLAKLKFLTTKLHK